MTPSNPVTATAQEASPTVVPLRHRGLSDVTAAAVDPADLNSPHTLAVLSVPPGAAVLDVGCGPGIVSRALAERGCRVWGIEIDARKAALARASCVEVAEADLEAVSLPTLFGPQRFDAILCLDVLEHLRDPGAVLAELRAMLAPGGAVLISVPNVTHGALRLELLQGRFGYRNSGLLDRGHLRFFDGRALADLVRAAGLAAETTLRVIKRLDQTEFEIDLDTVPAAVRELLEHDADALTYQFFVVARPLRDGQPRDESASLAERLRARVDQVTAELEKAGTYARSLEAELKEKDAYLQGVAGQASQIAELTAEIEKAGTYARSLEAELKQKNAHLQGVAGQASQIAEFTAELEKAGTYARHLEAEVENRDQRIRELEHEGHRAGALTSELASATDRATRLEAERLEASAQVETQRVHAASLEAELYSAGKYGRHLEAELAASQARAEALAVALTAAEQATRQQLDASTARAAELEACGADMRRLLDDQLAYARYLEGELQQRVGELAIYDDELHVLRAHVQKTEAAIAERDAQLGAAGTALSNLQATLDGHVREMEQREGELRLVRHELAAARRALGERDGELAAVARESAGLAEAIDEQRQRVSGLTQLVERYRVRLASRGADAFVQRAPGLYRVLRGVLAAVLDRWRLPEYPR